MEKDENLGCESNENMCLAWEVTIQLPNIGDLFGKCVSIYQENSLDGYLET